MDLSDSDLILLIMLFWFCIAGAALSSYKLGFKRSSEYTIDYLCKEGYLGVDETGELIHFPFKLYNDEVSKFERVFAEMEKSEQPKE
jgi:hypothetical protein